MSNYTKLTKTQKNLFINDIAQTAYENLCKLFNSNSLAEAMRRSIELKAFAFNGLLTIVDTMDIYSLIDKVDANIHPNAKNSIVKEVSAILKREIHADKFAAVYGK